MGVPDKTRHSRNSMTFSMLRRASRWAKHVRRRTVCLRWFGPTRPAVEHPPADAASGRSDADRRRSARVAYARFACCPDAAHGGRPASLKAEIVAFTRESGAGGRTRTDDLLITNHSHIAKPTCYQVCLVCAFETKTTGCSCQNTLDFIGRGDWIRTHLRRGYGGQASGPLRPRQAQSPVACRPGVALSIRRPLAAVTGALASAT